MTEDFVVCRVPQVFIDNAGSNSVTITNVDLMYTDDNSAGGVLLGYPFVQVTPSMVAYLDCHVTAAQKYTIWNFTNLEVAAEASMVNTTTQMIWVGLTSGHAAADSLYVMLRGYIESARLAPELQAVSVEGYKWPLQRRF